jgi:general secretion pathway protein G
VVAGVLLAACVVAFALQRLTRDDSLLPAQRVAREQARRLDGLFRQADRVMGHYPSEAQGFQLLVESRVLPEVPRDPWGHPYVYRVLGRRGYVVSLGADGVAGGQGEAADVFSGGLVGEERP